MEGIKEKIAYFPLVSTPEMVRLEKRRTRL